MTQLTLALDDLFDELDRENEAPKVRRSEANESSFEALVNGFIPFLENIEVTGITAYHSMREEAGKVISDFTCLRDVQRLPKFIARIPNKNVFDYERGAYITEAIQRCPANRITLNLSGLKPINGLYFGLKDKKIITIGNVGDSCGLGMERCELTVVGGSGMDLGNSMKESILNLYGTEEDNRFWVNYGSYMKDSTFFFHGIFWGECLLRVGSYANNSRIYVKGDVYVREFKDVVALKNRGIAVKGNYLDHKGRIIE